MELKELRKKTNQSQSTVAQALGIPRTTYINYENGIAEMDYSMLVKVADFFNVTVDELLGRTSTDIFANARIEQPEILQLYEQMTPAEQSNLVNYARGLISGRELRSASTSAKKNWA